jgi:hypothetical protein
MLGCLSLLVLLSSLGYHPGIHPAQAFQNDSPAGQLPAELRGVKVYHLDPEKKPATEPPPSLPLEPGAHLLLVLSSVSRLPNGSFQFRGALFLPGFRPGTVSLAQGAPLPVLRAGPVALDRGAEVIGAWTISQGQTSLAVTEFAVQGARYTLKVGNGAMKAKTPGAGGAVQFDRSQLLLIWPTSPSVYEKSPDTSAPPQPQR